MGAWRIEQSIYGEIEVWIPSPFMPDEWPTGEDGEPGIAHGIIPPPCATCIGMLNRRIHSDVLMLEFHWKKAHKAWVVAHRKNPDTAGPEPERPTEAKHYHYDLVHIANRHRKAEQASIEPGGDRTLDLRPHERV